ncbi:MAG: hypothetical protein WC307_05260 [Candidatus Nanoarchaeia archaeon]|jgi:hypothetical protein
MVYVTNAKCYSLAGLTTTDVSDADMTIFEAYAEGIINARTGYNYSSATNIDEFKEVELKPANKSFITNSGIPEYAYDYDQCVYRFTLDKLPVNYLNSVYVTNNYSSINQAWSSDGATYTDVSSELNTEYSSPHTVFPTGVISDEFYLGCAYKFSKFRVFMSTVGTDGTVTASYYNGTSWTSLTLTDGTTGFRSSGEVSFTLHADFSLATVNNVESYYVKFTVGTGYTVNPVVTSIVIDNDYVVYDTVSLKNVKYNSNGEVVVEDWTPEAGFRKLRFNYNYGSSTVPSVVEQLCGVIAAQCALASLIGATYNDITSGTMGDETFGTGEQYMNLKNAIEQLKIQEATLWKLVSKRIVLEVV